MTIIGIDPGLATTGYGIISLNKNRGKRLRLIDYGIIKTQAKEPFAKRLEKIYNSLQELILKYKPSQAAVEKIFFAKNVKTAMLVGQARGVVILVLVQNKIPIFEFTPLELKMALIGYGQASKSQIQQMIKNILHLKEIPRPDDAADGLALAIFLAWNSQNKIKQYAN